MKKIIKYIILIVIINITFYTIYNYYQENKIQEKQNNFIQEDFFNTAKNENSQKYEKTNNKESKNTNLYIPQKYKGYEVSAKLKIEKLKIDTYVLKEYSKSAMETCVTKYFGPNPNEIGNYCIAGHNYIRKNMFSELKKLNIGDQISLTDNFHGEVCYEIYDKYKVKPTQNEVLSQKTNGEKHITLITCSDYSKKRIIIKAKEKIKQ